MALEKKWKKDKEILQDFEIHSKDIRQQLAEQLKCLENRLEIHTQMVTEIQEFYRSKAELEQQYSRNLEKLVKSTWARHKQEKQKREHWDKFSTFNCWQQLLEITRKQSHDHSTLAEICGNQVISRLSEVLENSQRIFKKCRDIGSESHDDMLKILNELQRSMKTYHQYQNESKQAEEALKKVQSQKSKVEQQLSGKSLTSSRKFKRIEKQEDEKQDKYTMNKLKALKARNEYLLSIDVANAAINKYFADDAMDLMDCMDFGYHNSIRGTILIYQSAHCNLRNSHATAIDQLNNVISKMDPLTDKQKFLEINNQHFMLPKKFEFQPCRGDEIRQISAQKTVQDQLLQSYKSSERMLETLKLENDETWKSLEATEKSLQEMVNRKDVDVTSLFMDENHPPKSPHEIDRKRSQSQRLETEGYYLDKFRTYTLSNNRIARLQAKYSAIQKALGEDTLSSKGTPVRPPSLPPKPKKRRIGRNPAIGQPKLFGGNLEEYIDVTGQEIPLVIKSCVRIINLHGMHHQGIFRVSGSQVEINDMKNAFEKGDDPLLDEDACERINSAAGVLKLFFRELKPPLFPLQLFDELIACSRLDHQAKLEKIKELLATLPRSIIIVMRYLFSFLNHLSEYSDENMMDPYNLAICFGPTLLPIPPDRDQVVFQGSVNDVIKTIITHPEDILICEGGEMYEKYIVDVSRDSLDGMEEEEEEEENSSIQSDDEDTEVYEATALYDFTGRTDRELSFKKGDNLLLYTKASADWWDGAFAGKEGLVPVNYVALKHPPDSDKRSLISEEDKSAAVSSLSTSKSSLPETQTDTSLSHEPSGTVQETDIDSVMLDSSVHKGPSTMSSSVIVESVRETNLDDTPLLSAGRRQDLKRQLSSPETSSENRKSATEDLIGMENVLQEIFSDVRSLEMQQKSDKRMSLPMPKAKSNKDTPDLVLDLPEGSNSPSPQEGGEQDSPTMSAAETFAKSNQGTLKKASSMPRNISTSEAFTVGSDKMGMVPSMITGPILSTFSYIGGQRPMRSTSPQGRKFSLEESNLRTGGAPARAEKPKPPVMKKPAVMKKPVTRSPEVLRRVQQLETESSGSSSTSTPSGVK